MVEVRILTGGFGLDEFGKDMKNNEQYMGCRSSRTSRLC